MPLFAIRRNLGPATQEEFDAAVYRAIICAYEYPDLKWIRSFWNPEQGEIHCYYEARDVAQLQEHAYRSAIPCDEVSLVTEILPESYMATGSQTRVVPATPLA